MTDERLEQIGRYRIVDVLGEGAMGVVYRAQDTVLDRPVAVKVMTDAIAREPDLRERFLREARAAGALQHPNVVTIYDFGEMDGFLYIAMELVPGIDLSHVLSHGVPLPLDTKLAVVAGMLTGLGYAHKRGVVHRDVKPANVRVTEDGAVKIMDFGIAHVASSELTRTGMTMGTPSYMAPEQVEGTHVTPQTDIFAAGVVLYELLAGAKPFVGPTLHSILYKIVSEEPPDVFTGVAGIPSSLPPVVFRALAKAPADRYGDALAMAHDLNRVRAELSQNAGTTGIVAAVASATSLVSPLRTRPGASTGGAVGVISFPPATGPGSLGAASFPPGTFGPASTSGAGTLGTASNPTAGSLAASAPPASAAAATAGRSRTVVAITGAALVLVAGSAIWAASRRHQPTAALSSAQSATNDTGAHTDDHTGASTGPTATSTIAPNSGAPSNATPTQPTPAATSLTTRDSTRAPTRPPAPSASNAPTPSVRTSSGGAAQQQPVQPPSVGAAITTTSPPPLSTTVGRPTPTPPPVPTTPASVAAPASSAAVVPPIVRPTASGVRDAIEAYARALETRDLSAVRRVYPAITGRQESGWRALFDATSSLAVTLGVSDVQVNGTTATATVAGQSAFVMNDGHRQTQPLNFRATLRHDGTAWRLAAVQ